ncbi:MAG: hypothetical protein ACI4XL_08465 [Bacillus sp. (in: firmicutes)]
MGPYLFDLLIVTVLVIGLTALNGVIGNSIGNLLFGGKKRSIHKEATVSTQTGWKRVGGK